MKQHLITIAIIVWLIGDSFAHRAPWNVPRSAFEGHRVSTITAKISQQLKDVNYSAPTDIVIFAGVADAYLGEPIDAIEADKQELIQLLKTTYPNTTIYDVPVVPQLVEAIRNPRGKYDQSHMNTQGYENIRQQYFPNLNLGDREHELGVN